MNSLWKQQGFTLLEVLFSIILLSFSLLIFNTFFINNMSQNTKQETQQIAINIARQKIEQWQGFKDDLTKKNNDILTLNKTDFFLGQEKIVDKQTINNQTYAACLEFNEFDPLYILTIRIYQGSVCQSSNVLSTLHTSIKK